MPESKEAHAVRERTRYRQVRRKRHLSEVSRERKVLFQFRIPEGLLGRIARMTQMGITTGKYPWKTNSETLRGLVVKGLESMSNHGDDFVDELLPYIKLTRQFDGLRANRIEAQTSFNRASHEIAELLGIGAKHEALSYYHVTMQAAGEMPATVWRDWFLFEMRKKFKDLDATIPAGISLAPVEFDARAERSYRQEKAVVNARRYD